MKRLTFLAVTACSLLACSIDQNYMDCLYDYLTSKEFKVNGAFYKYDFNHDGVTQRSDWIYVDLGTQNVYQLLGLEPTSNNRFGWKPMDTIPSDLDTNNVAGIFVYLGFPQDPDTAFSWLYIPLIDNFVAYKLAGADANGNFVYMDFTCDGVPDPIPDLQLKDFKAPSQQNIDLPGTESGGDYFMISFDYPYQTFCNGTGGTTSSQTISSSSSFGTSSSVSSSTSLTSSSSITVSQSSSSSSSVLPQITWWKKVYLCDVYSLTEKSDGSLLAPSFVTELENPENGSSYTITRSAGLFQLDRSGNPVWAKDYTQISESALAAVGVTQNDDVIAAGIYESGGFLLKTDPNGTLQWAKEIDGEDKVIFASLQKAGTNRWIVAGSGYYPSDGKNDAVMLLFNEDGSFLWQKRYGSPLDDGFQSVRELKDGGSVAVGYTTTAPLFGGHNIDGLIVRVDKDGRTLWQKRFAGAKTDLFYAVRVDEEGNIIISGYTFSFDTEAKGIVLKLSPQGDLLWARLIGDVDHGVYLGSMTVGANEYVVGGDVDGKGYLLAIDEAGNQKWQKMLTIENSDVMYLYRSKIDSSLLMVLSTEAFNGSFIVKGDSEGEVEGCNLLKSVQIGIKDVTTKARSLLASAALKEKDPQLKVSPLYLDPWPSQNVVEDVCK